MMKHWISLLWFLGQIVPTTTFLLPSISNLSRTCKVTNQPILATLSPFSPSVASTTTTASSTSDDSRALLEVLLQRYQTKGKPDYDISGAIERLKNARVSFDPAECFNGPLYVVLHQQGPTQPLWEKIGIVKKQTNQQGQKYVFKPETNDFEIVNYAELFGKNLFIQVEGTAIGRESVSKNNNKPQPSFLEGITNLFNNNNNHQNKPQSSTNRRLQCPCEIVATGAGGGLYLNGNKVLPLNFIQGTGVVRVLYADPNLRILESPYQNNGGWEDQGLVVVQVREDWLP